MNTKIPQNSQSDNSLSKYIPNSPPHKPSQNHPTTQTQTLQKQLQTTKKQLTSLQNTQSYYKNKLANKLQHIQNMQKQVLELYKKCQLKQYLGEVAQELQGKQKQENQYKNKSLAIQNVYLQQLRISDHIQDYINKIQQKITINSLKLTKKMEKIQTRQKQPKLPSANQLHGQVLEQIENCQGKFNQLMDTTQRKIQEQLRSFCQAEKILIDQMGVIVESRIKFLQGSCNSKQNVII